MTYLNLMDRKIIERMYHNDHAGYRTIARALGRPHSTVHAEILANITSYDQHYDAEKAHARFLRRQMRKGKRRILERNTALKEHIVFCLAHEQWSPEEIAGHLEATWGQKIISHETIYQFIYSEEGKNLKLWLHLRHKKKPMRIQRGTRKKREAIIHDRTPVACRGPKRFGDLETDSMIFSKQKPILSVQVETISKRCVLTRLPNKTAQETHDALRKCIVTFGEGLVRSLTFDNGTENTLHTKLKQDFEIQTYFCDPYCSWQKGLVENTNKLIRQYLPRWTNMNTLSEHDLYCIQEKLNNRPRKLLNYKTPNQIFDELSLSGRI